jgi:threonine dehydratase
MSPIFQDIIDAKARISPFINQTPFLSCPPLNDLLGANVFIKAECLQPRGAFKIRGATNAILKQRDAAIAKGVIAYSSGNHAQGVALACKRIGARATIIVPDDAPTIKLDNARADGAKIIFYNRRTQSREEIGQTLQNESGAIIIPPYDHQDVIAGQGTIGLEIAEFANNSNFEFEYILSPASGGGLASGITLALENQSPNTKMLIAEPFGFERIQKSLAAGQRVENAPPAELSIQDALMSPTCGELTFPILQRNGAKAFGVKDDDCLRAMKFAFENLQIIIEPGGAAALALAMFGKLDLKGKNICIIASGGNVDAQMFCKAIKNSASLAL